MGKDLLSRYLQPRIAIQTLAHQYFNLSLLMIWREKKESWSC